MNADLFIQTLSGDASRNTMIRKITEQLNGDQDVLADGWEHSTTDELTELYNTLVVDVQRERIQDHIENGQTRDSYSIGRARLDWVAGRQEYLLTLPDGTTEWEGGGCGDCIGMIDDEDIIDFYNEEVADYYEDEEAA
jgi:hypothetical protein